MFSLELNEVKNYDCHFLFQSDFVALTGGGKELNLDRAVTKETDNSTRQTDRQTDRYENSRFKIDRWFSQTAITNHSSLKQQTRVDNLLKLAVSSGHIMH